MRAHPGCHRPELIVGMANYYLKARFADSGRARRALPRVKAFLTEAMEAGAWWQDHRGETQMQFWPAFIKQFPLTVEFLKTCAPDNFNPNHGTYKVTRAADTIKHPLDGKEPTEPEGRLWCECGNGPAGVISFGGDEDGDIDHLDRAKDVILYWAEVWHGASWNKLCQYLVSHFGATNSDWASDEHLDPFDTIEV